MNRERRKLIDKIIRCLDDVKTDVEGVLEDEQSYFDEMPENFQDSERGEVAQEAIDNLQNAIDQIDEVIELAETAKG
jgi:hypothetical protein